MRSRDTQRKIATEIYQQTSQTSRWLMYTSELSSLFLSLVYLLQHMTVVSCDLCLTHIGHVSVCFALPVDLVPLCKGKKKYRVWRSRLFSFRFGLISGSRNYFLLFIYFIFWFSCHVADQLFRLWNLLLVWRMIQERPIVIWVLALWAILTPFHIYLTGGWCSDGSTWTALLPNPQAVESLHYRRAYLQAPARLVYTHINSPRGKLRLFPISSSINYFAAAYSPIYRNSM